MSVNTETASAQGQTDDERGKEHIKVSTEYWSKRTALSRVAPIISGWICSGISIRP